MPNPPKNPDEYSPAEIERRMADGLRRALTTPHRPNTDYVVGKGKKKKVGKKRSS